MKELQESEVSRFFDNCITTAKQATCTRSKCGSIIVKDNEIIGRGFNSPPQELKTQRRCKNQKSEYHKKVTDKTCCIHAEQRAIMDALKNYPNKIKGSRLYFIRLDENDEKALVAGKPYCTICSKMALDVGISEFVLWHDYGIIAYDTQEYNNLSYEYNENEN
ncbi:MAG: hypothetical protein ACOCXG_03925 [Nanoarchaeota archaeon]